MGRGSIFAAVLAATVSLFGTTSSKAAIVLSIGLQEAGVNGGAITTTPGGNVSYGNFTIGSLDLAGPGDLASPNLLFADSFNVKSKSSGTLNVFFTVQGLTVPSSGVIGLLSSFDGILSQAAGSVLEKTFVGLGNGQFSTSNLISQSPLYTSGSNATNLAGYLAGLVPGSPFSLTEEFTITATAKGQTFQAAVNVAAVPEPGTWALMGIGFACLGFLAYRRKGNPAAAFRFA